MIKTKIYMNRTIKGILSGTTVGLIDIIPMLAQKLAPAALLSAFTMWVVIGFLLSVIKLNLNGAAKGVFISFLVLAPTAIIIGFQEPLSLLPICIMTLILGSLLGTINR